MGFARHTCDPQGKPVGTLDTPGYALPGDAVRLPEVDMFGRVRLVWRCCGAFLIEHYTDQGDATGTQTVRVRADELAPVPWHISAPVPHKHAPWSLNLPCGHLAGEGCDCDTIAAEADGQD